MSGDSWNDRRRALEDSFFMEKNKALLDKIKAEQDKEAKKKALAAASGILDEKVLEQLVEANIDARTVAALSIVPLVAVAWADGNVDKRERDAILMATKSEGIERDSVCSQLLAGWLDNRPDSNLMDAWKGYVKALGEHMDGDAVKMLRDDVLERATKVAKAAGGILGMNAITTSEQRVLDELRTAFSA